ncbi:unnamed protein product [Rotaria socialis]|uniref:Uncharacterized protein n=1 Tax=Rotaria socialis TaxID=392032 RepID=A0A821BC71_9BILA|nr:unnamed protein product [Rotaria socialis]
MVTMKGKCAEHRTNNAAWQLGSINNDVENGLQVCKDESSTEYEEMVKHLKSTPGKGISCMLSQMRLDTHVWEYKLPYNKRVLYILDDSRHRVMIGYAGQHLNKRRTDKKIQQLVKMC